MTTRRQPSSDKEKDTSPTRRPRPWDGLSDQEKLEIKEIFSLCDLDSSGAIDWRELRGGLRGLGFPVSKREAQDMISHADLNGDGLVDFQEFLSIVEHLSRSEVDIRREIMLGFKHFDREDNGFITLEDLVSLCKNLDEYIPRDDLREMFALADLDSDGKVTKQEFLKIMLKTNLFR